MEEEIPNCPSCGKNDKAKRMPCRCMSCPPYCCFRCKPYEEAGYVGYEYYWPEDDDD